jgi:inorganic pyrophosphatase
MHPWHEVPVDEQRLAEFFPVVIEVPAGSENQYELDRATGLLRLARVLHSAVRYPANYGFVPRTLGEDGDPLDALVLGQAPIHPLTLVKARAIAVMRMRDDAGPDDILLAVSINDPVFVDYRDHRQLPVHMLREIRRFFEDYTALEDKSVMVGDLYDAADALQVLRAALARYREHRPDEPLSE